jgi:hypothetical protein
MDQRSRFFVLAALAAGAVAFLRRPVKPPDPKGNWRPADRQRTRS